jgi:hypothetical protein
VINLDQVTILLGNGNGTFASPVNVGVGAGSDPRQVAVGDFNHDGIADFAVSKRAKHRIGVYYGQPGGNGLDYMLDGDYTSSPFPMGVVAANLNPGNWLDLAGANSGGSTVTVFLNLERSAPPGDGASQPRESQQPTELDRELSDRGFVAEVLATKSGDKTPKPGTQRLSSVEGNRATLAFVPLTFFLEPLTNSR